MIAVVMVMTMKMKMTVAMAIIHTSTIRLAIEGGISN